MQNDTDLLDQLEEKWAERANRKPFCPCNVHPRKWTLSLTLLGDDKENDRTWIEFVTADEREANSAYDNLSAFDYPAPGVIVKSLWSPEGEDGLNGLEVDGVVLPAQAVQ